MKRAAPLTAGLVAFALYLANGRTIGSGDTAGPALVPVALLTRGTLEMSPYVSSLAPPGMLPYYLAQREGGVWPVYSSAPGLLVTPLYAPIVWWFGRVARTPADWVAASLRWQKPAAACITAISVAVFLDLLLALGAGTATAVVLTTGYGLGSEAWAVSSQALWQHGPATLGLLVTARMAVAYRKRRTLATALAGGLALAVVAAVRPYAVVVTLPIAAWGAWGSRRMTDRMCWGVPALVAGAAWWRWSDWMFGHALGKYHGEFSPPSGEALAGLLLSPARGLLPYFPVALLAVPGFMAARRTGWRLVIGGGAAVYLALLTLHVGWHAGHGFGPRHMAELQPVLLLLALPWIGRNGRRMAFAAALIGWGVFIQSVGAFLQPAGCWDDDPVQVESAPDRLWDWRDNPVSREIHRALHPLPDSTPLRSWSARYHVPATLDVPPGETVRVAVAVTNTGSEPWPVRAGAECGCIVHLSWHLRDAAGRPVRYEGTRAALGRSVGPGESVTVNLPVTASAEPGRYLLDITLVQERVGWFEDRGVRPAVVRLEVPVSR